MHRSLHLDIADFGTKFSGSYQLLHPQTGFSALSVNTTKSLFYVVRNALADLQRAVHMLTSSLY